MGGLDGQKWCHLGVSLEQQHDTQPKSKQNFENNLCLYHRHLSNIDCLMACTACLFASLVLLTAVAKKGKKRIKIGASSGHITNLKQSIWRLSISMYPINTVKYVYLYGLIASVYVYGMNQAAWQERATLRWGTFLWCHDNKSKRQNTEWQPAKTGK